MLLVVTSRNPPGYIHGGQEFSLHLFFSFPFLPFLPHVSSASKNKLYSQINLGVLLLHTIIAGCSVHAAPNLEGSRPVAGLSTLISLLAQNGKDSSRCGLGWSLPSQGTRLFAPFVATLVLLFHDSFLGRVAIAMS